MSMSSFAIEHRNMPARDIYKPDNHLKDYISVDLRKANLSTLSKMPALLSNNDNNISVIYFS